MQDSRYNTVPDEFSNRSVDPDEGVKDLRQRLDNFSFKVIART